MAVSELSLPVRPNRTPSKSCTHFLCKSLIFALFLVVIPLFPSQAPEYINHTLITKFWELLHLLFIGIAVSYGVFSRRNVDRGIESHSTVFHVSSIFEDGFENSCGSGEKSVIQTWNSQHFQGESMVVVTSGSSVLDKRANPDLQILKMCVKTYLRFSVLQGETMVVVAKGSYALDQWGKPESRVDDKSLGLPVRSLKSRIKDTDSTESVSGSRSKSSSKTGSSKSSGKVINGKFGKLGPLKLEEQLKETVALPSPIPCRSRSGRMEMREEADSFHSHSHSMPPSFEEPEFERLQSRSFRSSASYSSQTSSVSSSPRKLGNSKMEELGRRKSLYGSSTATSPSPPGQMNGKAPLDMSRSHQFFDGSASEMNAQRSFEDERKELSRSRREDQVNSKEWQLGSMKSAMKPGPPKKHLSRGRSVRTFRSSELTSEARKVAEKGGNRIDDSVWKTYIKAEEVPMEKSDMKSKVLGNTSYVTKPPFSKHPKGEMQESEDLEGEAHNFRTSSDEEVASNIVGEEEPVPHEVDKKAGEFIAKFKEQIRLQKMASIRGHTWENVYRNSSR
ncbi:hypothetical protein AAG906_024620 [Vitis piasezkii]